MPETEGDVDAEDKTAKDVDHDNAEGRLFSNHDTQVQGPI